MSDPGRYDHRMTDQGTPGAQPPQGRHGGGNGNGNDDDDDRAERALLQRLQALPRVLPAPEASARIHGRARRLFLSWAPTAPGTGTGALRVRLSRLYARVEPALAATVVVIYLGWAIETVLAIKR